MTPALLKKADVRLEQPTGHHYWGNLTMRSQHNLSLSVTLPYPQAGIAFHLHGECRKDHAPTIEIKAVPGTGDQPLALLDNAVPVLEDFAPGFARWLRTCQVTAEVLPQAIRGAMPPETVAGQLLLAISRSCDMIEQRFSLYTETILD